MSNYDPGKQGRKDGRLGKARHKHMSSFNQQDYDREYDPAYAQWEKEENARQEELRQKALEANHELPDLETMEMMRDHIESHVVTFTDSWKQVIEFAIKHHRD